MAREFRPLKEIVDDPSVQKGDLILVKQGIVPEGMDIVLGGITPCFYSGQDTYVADSERDNLKEGTEFKGIRVFNTIDMRGNGKHTFVGLERHPFCDRDKGLFLPFDYSVLCEYALALKGKDLPK